MSHRVFIAGTHTEIGKTSFVQALLESAHIQGIKAIPFKPAQSGVMKFEESDAGRLMASAKIPFRHHDLVAPHRYEEDRAPGCVEGANRFTQKHPLPSRKPIQTAQTCLSKLEALYEPSWSFCEGAGGLWVPMPGGTWQPEWIRKLSQATIVVAPIGLGTINHTILTVRALETMKQPILGIAWTGCQACKPALAIENMDIVERATGLPRISEPDHAGSFQLIENVFGLLSTRYDRCRS